jgi:hypothetical protein
LLLAGAALWLLWSILLDHLHGNDYLRAGYLNSRFPHSLRNVFSFAHILLWLGWMWTILAWLGAGVIAIFVFAATAGRRPFRALACAARSLTYWTSLILGVTCATMLTGSLMQWTPGNGLRTETFSLVFRLGVAALVDATVVSFLLAVLAMCVRRTDGQDHGDDALYSTPNGTLDESQPRTVGRP